MRSVLKRRDALKAIMGGTAALWLGRSFGSVTGGYDPSEPLSVERVTPRLVIVRGAGANVVAARGSSGVALVDGGLASRADEILKLVGREMGTSKVDVLFNTHWHPERVGLNLPLGRAGAKIIAHENTRLWLTEPITRPWDEQPIQPLPREARPTQTFYTKGELAFGDQPIRYGYMLQSHTDGDIYTFFPAENVLVTGGVIASDTWPLIDWRTGGWILGLVDGLDVLIDVANDATRVVPGSGPILKKADLVAQREMYLAIYDRILKLFFKGKSPAEAVAAAPTKEFNPEWGDPGRFVTLAFQSMWGQFTPNV